MYIRMFCFEYNTFRELVWEHTGRRWHKKWTRWTTGALPTRTTWVLCGKLVFCVRSYLENWDYSTIHLSLNNFMFNFRVLVVQNHHLPGALKEFDAWQCVANGSTQSWTTRIPSKRFLQCSVLINWDSLLDRFPTYFSSYSEKTLTK